MTLSCSNVLHVVILNVKPNLIVLESLVVTTSVLTHPGELQLDRPHKCFENCYFRHKQSGMYVNCVCLSGMGIFLSATSQERVVSSVLATETHTP